MNILIHNSRALVCLCLLIAAGTSLIPAFCGAEMTAADNTAPANNQDATQAILHELREIRRELEKIEQQGLERPARRPDTPKTASVRTGEGNAMLGAADAPVTVIEFTDYQRPFCKRFV